MKRLAIPILLTCISLVTQAQTDTTKYIKQITFKIEKCAIAQTNDFLKGLNKYNKKIESMKAITLGMGWQTTGKKEWQQIHNLPSFGVALYTAKIEHDEEIGQPISLFGYYKGVFHRWNKSALRYNIDLGLAFNWKYFDINTNPYNITIGSPVTVHIGFGGEYEYLIAKRVAVALGYNFTHFSNGAIRKPNKGMNTTSPYIRLTYMLEEFQTKASNHNFGRMKGNEIQITLGYGFKQQELYEKWKYSKERTQFESIHKYKEGTLKLTYLHQYSHKGKYGAGLGVCCDEWLRSGIYEDENGDVHKIHHGSLIEATNLGLFASHEFLISKLAILTDIGGYLHQHSNPEFRHKGYVFERLGIKYYLPLNMFAGVNVFAHGFAADYVEWNVGYTIPWGQHIKY